MSGKRRQKVSLERVRSELFILWCSLMLMYVSMFLLCTFKEPIAIEQTSEAAWQVAYMFVPVIGAFAGFWFTGTNLMEAADNKKTIDASVRWKVYLLATVLHVPVLCVFLIAIAFEDFEVITIEAQTGFRERVKLVMQFLFLVWSVSLLPVGWVLNRSSGTVN